MIEVKRGCGSWECGCLTPHSLPFEVAGHARVRRRHAETGPEGHGPGGRRRSRRACSRWPASRTAGGSPKGTRRPRSTTPSRAFEALQEDVAGQGHERAEGQAEDRLRAPSRYTSPAPPLRRWRTEPAEPAAGDATGRRAVDDRLRRRQGTRAREDPHAPRSTR